MNFDENNFEFLDIDKIEIIKENKIMYDIEVEDDNTFYISNGEDDILVHNCDGNHIRGLMMNFFDTYWPELLHMDFIYDFTSPIVKATKGKITKYYYKLKEYERDKDKLKGYDIKWIKGLGTIEPSEMKEFFKKIDKHLVRFHYDKPETEDLLDMLFNTKRSDDRKDWLKNYTPIDFIDKLSSKQTYDKFINNELIEFSMYNNVRQIQNSIDGFKPSQRKTLYTLIKKNIKSDIKVSSLSGSVISEASYHHGNSSIEEAIVGMAQDFVGKNNINILYPKGQFGSRIKGGQDSASARYIFTKLNDITEYIFRKEDNDILDYLNDDGFTIEPKYYVPIIPMVLVNGSFGLGSGYSSNVPMFNPIDIISYLISKLTNKKPKKLIPYYKGFKGDIILDENNNRYTTRGKFEIINDNSINITELPIGTWNDQYFKKLDKLIEEKKIKDYIKNCTDEIIDIKVFLTKDNFDFLFQNKDDVYKKLNLETYISTDNMHLFDSEQKIKKYKDQYEIIDDFYEIRMMYYIKRKEYQLNKKNIELNILLNKIRFLKLVMDDTIIINKKSKDIIERDLEKNNFDRIENTYNYLLNMSISSFTKEKLQELRDTTEKLKSSITTLKNTTESDIWLSDLKELKGKIGKDY